MASNWRAAIAFTFIGGGALLLFYLLLNDGSSEPEAGPLTSVTLSTTTTTVPTTTSTTGPTTTTTVDADLRKAEVERILEDLELTRLVAIHDKDEEALLAVLATQRGYDAAVAAMETLEFVADPSEVGLEIKVFEVLLDQPNCLVAHREFDGRESLGDQALAEGVRVLWPQTEGGSDYRLAALWSSPADLWVDDCDVVQTEFP